MAIFEWRKFNFFDLRKSVDKEKVNESLLKDANITATTNGNNLIVICDSKGYIHVFTRTWEAVSFKGHDGVILLCAMSTQNNLLVTVGEDVNGPSFKVWNLSKMTSINGAQCLRTVKTALQKPTSLAVSEGGQFMAIGFERGNISLYRGDISRDRTKTLKQLMAGTSQITGLAFKHTHKTTQMFVCSDSGVYLYNFQSRDKDGKEGRIILDSITAPARCCSLQMGHNEGQFMIGRDDAVYCYTSDGRGPCYALDGQKSLIQWFRSHLLIVSKNSRAATSAQNNILTVIDIQNKFIVFTCPIEDVAAFLIEFGTCFILTKNKTVFHLDEKDLQSKLNLLFKKNLYDIAVRIAKCNQYDSEGLAGIFKQYGDHLYSKGDFSGSVEQYSKTIGYLEPSYVIRRFLDARHINYLTEYLQILHKQGQATADHTTLLLNCFTRLDRTEQLKDFLKNDQKSNLFDVDVAIKVCRNASIEQALSLAKWNKKHDSCLSILTEDLHSYDEALKYIEYLQFIEAEKNMKKYGNVLMEKCPDATIKLLKKLCTDYVSDGNTNEKYGGDILLETGFSSGRGNPEDFIHLFSNSNSLIDFLEHLIKCIPSCSQLVYNTLIEHYLYSWENDSSIECRLMEILRNHNEMYDKNHVLIQCRVYKFWPGVMFLYEDEKLYHLILRHYLKNGDYNNLLNCCKRLGPLQPSLWLQALTGLKNDANAPANLLSQVLHVISQEKLQSPLQILNCLAVENGPLLLSVRDYFTQVFQKEYESTRHDEDLTKKYCEESVAIKKHIKHLQEGNIEFRSTLCDTCYQPLSMPALYFLCQHSYHQDCIRGYSETEKDCPVCHKKNLQLVDVLRAQSESRGQHEIFHNLLDRSPEPFSVVAEYFGRGLFNKIVIVEEAETINTANISVNDDIKQVKSLPEQQTRIDTNAKYNNFGPSAEAKMRQDEFKSKQVQKELLSKPVPEARMRIQEQQRYSTSLEANVQWGAGKNQAVKNDKSPNRSPKPPPVNTISKQIAKSSNPFGEEEEYDEGKNPFAEDDEPSENVARDKTNPFEEYDNNLNPFAE